MHTPIPWHVNELLPSGKHINSGCGPIAVTITSEDAAFIVTACNVHDALVAALHHTLYRNHDFSEVCDGCLQARAALALVTPKEAVR